MTGPGPDPDAPPPRTGEFARIDRYLKPLAAGFPGALGLCDDAGLVDVPSGEQLVVTTDAMVAGVHFLAEDDPADIAAKLLRVNLSDLAAKGARPLAYSLVTALPRELPDDWLARFCLGLEADQRRFGIHLLGGDSVSTAGPVNLTISALGLVSAGRMVRRSGALPGDAVLVSGSIGCAALGLAVALDHPEAAAIANADRAALLARLRRPEPRLALAPVLLRHATASLDISDGLVADLGHLARASGVALDIEADRVPLSSGVAAAVAKAPDLLALALTGGDDYEVAFTLPAARVDDAVAEAAALGVAVTRVGTVTAGAAGVRVLRHGTTMDLQRRGWEHF